MISPSLGGAPPGDLRPSAAGVRWSLGFRATRSSSFQLLKILLERLQRLGALEVIRADAIDFDHLAFCLIHLDHRLAFIHHRRPPDIKRSGQETQRREGGR